MKKVHAIIQSLRVSCFNVIIIFLLVHTFFRNIQIFYFIETWKDVVPVQQSICLFEEYQYGTSTIRYVRVYDFQLLLQKHTTLILFH